MSRFIHPPRRVLRIVAALVVALVAAAVGLVHSGSAGATVTTLKTFATPGTYTWTVPTGVTNATFDVFGARGGGVVSVNHGIVTVISSGGAGGEAKAKFAVKAGQAFLIVVGGQGGIATLGTTPGTAGSNGGGAGSPTYYGGGGGGASDVRIGGRTNLCVASGFCGYPDRIIVGGGGGGGSSSGAGGAAGGGSTGSAGLDIAGGGKQTSAGFCQSHAPEGGFGVGGPGSSILNEQSESGGGGAGWYGGCGGGGGSGYISHFAASGSFPGGLSQGDGKVIITTTT